MDPDAVSVATGALAELIASAAATAARRTWKSLHDPEARTVTTAAARALEASLRDSVLPLGAVVTDEWIEEVAEIWRPAFTPGVLDKLVECLAGPSEASAADFAEFASQALQDAGCDLVMLGGSFWVEEFLSILPRRFFALLRAASLQDERVRGLVDHLLRQRQDPSAEAWPASPAEFRRDLILLLRGLAEQARAGRLPAYLPLDADVTALSRTVRVRLGMRPGLSDGRPEANPGASGDGPVYQLPAERPGDLGVPQPWPDVAGEYDRLVVLADPGMGKSWLIRVHTYERCQDALTRLHDGAGPEDSVVIPVPLRCDQLVTAEGRDLADKAAGHMVAQGLLAGRSRSALAGLLRTGRAILLLDALDEVTAGQKGPLLELVQAWSGQAGYDRQCVITSRIAGYTGSPMPGACEVELQAFTPEESVAAIAAWQLSPTSAAWLLGRIQDRALAAMARVPLLLALLCSLAMQQPAGRDLPQTRGQLYERVLRWFLTRAHRSPDTGAWSALDDLEVNALLEILAPLAFTFATPGGWIDRMPAQGVINAIRDAGPAFTERHRPAAAILRELSVGAGVLVPEGDPTEGRDPPYLFLHRTFAEYLVARHLAAQPDAVWLAVIDQHRWFDPDWAGVIPMIGERLSAQSARALVQHLTSGSGDPFNYSLLMAIQVWGARSDADDLLPPSAATLLAERVISILTSEQRESQASAAACIASLAFLPRILVAGLVGCLGHHNRQAGHAAAELLAARSEQGVTNALIARASDHDWIGRSRTVEILASRADPGTLGVLLARLADEHWSVRCTAVRAVAGREDGLVTDSMLACLCDQHENVRRAAVEAISGREDPKVIEALLARLADPDGEVRRATVKALAGHHGPRVIESLVDCLADSDWLVRCTAAEAVADVEGAGVTDALVALLADHNQSVRSTARRVLAGRDDPGVARALVARLDDRGVYMEDALEALVGKMDPAVTKVLIGYLTDKRDHVRRAALDALAWREGQGVTEALLACLADSDWRVRCAAVQAVAWREGTEVTPELLACLGDDHWSVRHMAMDAIAGSGTIDISDIYYFVSSRQRPSLRRSHDVGVMQALLDCLGHTDNSMRYAARDALSRPDNSGAGQALLDRLTGQSWSVRYEAGQALAHHKSPDVTESLIALLTHPEGDVRRKATELLGGRDGSDVTAALLGRLDDSEWRVRRDAAKALWDRKGDDVTVGLLARLADEDKGVRIEAVGALTGRKGPVVTEGVLALLADHDESVRLSAVRTLAGRDGENTIVGLLTCLGDVYWPVRTAAIRALADRQGDNVTQGLLACLTDTVEHVRLGAAKALTGRTGSDVTERLVDRLADHAADARKAAAMALAGRAGQDVTAALLARLADEDEEVRRAAVLALADRAGPDVTEGLLTARLSDPDSGIRYEAGRNLVGRDATEILLALANMVRQSRTITEVEEARHLMTRHYARLNPAFQPEVRAAMSLLQARSHGQS